MERPPPQCGAERLGIVEQSAPQLLDEHPGHTRFADSKRTVESDNHRELIAELLSLPDFSGPFAGRGEGGRRFTCAGLARGWLPFAPTIHNPGARLRTPRRRELPRYRRDPRP